ncbi:MAG TPA: hypothetical protein PLU36_09070 [Chitinophagaceae bacterium]|nr:hypothetical protein [Chitinophagaceae bacterium]MCC6634802.1 hypothetical protein [Chitinophagaceae bacterium]HMZ46940.1 hypothetical protein [Chitinophagaceae bacterium]HNE93443.1 hypothetical protein [Chitinophagaceae bacterium]HNF28653.1 hypothetical protein [Chitinophagaceae bacterium]
MKSVKYYIHFVWMLLFSVVAVNAQNSFNPTGYATSLKEALKEPENISTISVYYTRGMVFDIEQGKAAPDASFEKLMELNNLRTFRLNGCPLDFNQELFFCNLSKVKQLEALELRMNFRQLGLLTEQSIKCLKKLKNLRRLNLPCQYPQEDYIKLQQQLPDCEIIINVYPGGE